jgi:serine/threonine-protein kinase
MLPGSSDVPYAVGRVARREGHWDESIACFEQALSLDPRNVELLYQVAYTYNMLRQFPKALKLYDRALDITPNDPDLMVTKAGTYQAEGNLQKAAGFLSEVNEQTPTEAAFLNKITQLRLERNPGEAVRLLQARLAQFRFASQNDKGNEQVALAFVQRLVGDTAGARVTGMQARGTFEALYRDQPDTAPVAAWLSRAYTAMGQKESAVQAAERAIVLHPRAKDATLGPGFEENLAVIQTLFGENSSAISTLTELSQTSYGGGPALYAQTPITPALLRLDPLWDPLRSDPRFQKLCEKKEE